MRRKMHNAGKKGQRGQVSIEYFFLFVFLITIFVFFIYFSNEFKRTADISAALENNRAVAFSVAHTVNTVFTSANGAAAAVSVPFGYTISFQPRGIIATDQNNYSGSFSTMTSNVTINITSENATALTIVNQNGMVYING